MSAIDIYSVFEGDIAVSRPPVSFEWAGCRVDVLSSPVTVEAAWRSIETTGIASAFQTYDYISDWLRTASLASGETPLFVAGYDAGKACFILPLALRRMGGVSVLTWLAQAHANYGLGVYERTFFETRNGSFFDSLIREVARRSGAALVYFDAQPERWKGIENPFATGTSSQLTGNDTYIVSLDEDYASQYKRLFSSTSASKTRRKWRRISEMGSAEFRSPRALGDRLAALAWFIDTKGHQLAEAGRSNPFGPLHIRAFYSALAQRSSLRIDELTLDGEPHCAGMTLETGSSAYYVNTAFSKNSEISKYSPGYHLFHHIAACLHRAGVRMIDLGPGDVPYKRDWNPEIVNLRAALHLIKPFALPHYLVLRAAIAMKCHIKRNPALLEAAHRAISWTAGRFRHSP